MSYRVIFTPEAEELGQVLSFACSQPPTAR